jgi:hypothetical protein
MANNHIHSCRSILAAWGLCLPWLQTGQRPPFQSWSQFNCAKITVYIWFWSKCHQQRYLFWERRKDIECTHKFQSDVSESSPRRSPRHPEGELKK